MARRLDERPPVAELRDEMMAAPAESVSGPTADASRILKAIEDLPEPDREAFDFVRIQGMSQAEAAGVLGVSPMTVNRRLHRALKQLAVSLADLYPDEDDLDPASP
jgi:RNA polymerase sigma-70 factor (ECF subfamily)